MASQKRVFLHKFRPWMAVWLIFFGSRSSAVSTLQPEPASEDICVRAMKQPHPNHRIPIPIRDGTETSILLYIGPPIVVSEVVARIVSRPLNESVPYRDSELAPIQVYYNAEAGVGAIVSRTGELHANLYDLIVKPEGGQVLGGVRWFPNPSLAQEGTRRLPSKTFAGAPNFEIEEKYFEIDVVP